jgi:dienelactone hydrolase
MSSVDDRTQDAQDLVDQLAGGDFASARRLFDHAMTQAFSQARLKDEWQQLLGQVGPFQRILTGRAVERQGYQVITVPCQFERETIDLNVVFHQSGQIAGLNYQPASAPSPYHPPSYVQTTAFRDVEVTVGSGEWALPGTLSVANGAGPLPAVVLVHGSGPQDRDETLGPNRPFRDLAWGLASQGIAVLRYDKRTKVHAGKLSPDMVAQLTVQEEVVDDALLAVQLLRQTPRIAADRIYVLGHSLGATLAPRIGRQDPAIAGLIVMAGLTRRLEDTILDQFTYIYRLSGSMTDTKKADLERLTEQVARVKDPNLSDQVPAQDLPLNVHPAYWLSLRDYHPAEVAKSLGMRILVLQGGRDYQVTAAGDFPAWQAALSGKSNATLKLFPKLNHEFIAGEGPSTPQEYSVEGHVDEEVIRDIAGWIKSR